jgi:hypothetical protein
MEPHDPRIIALSYFLLGVSVGILFAMIWLGIFP